MTLSERDSKVIWHPFTQAALEDAPIGIVSGSGAILYDENGREFIDAISSWWVNIHGHAHPHIAQRVSEQLRILEHVIFAGFTHGPAVALAEQLLPLLPGNQKRIFYSDNGSTAVEVALKMALQYWDNKGLSKSGIIAFSNSYHGDTFGAMSVGARGGFNTPFEPLLFDVNFIDAPERGKEEASVHRLKKLLEKGNIAAFIYEPLIQGSGGMKMHEPEALNELLDICSANDVLTIADEVMTGFGRTGRLFASDHIELKPDIMCLSKGLTGGTMALGITSASEKIYNAFLSSDRSKALYHGHSFTANPLACTAALASLDLVREEAFMQNITRISDMYTQFLSRISVHPKVINPRHRGAILAFDLETKDNAGYFNNVSYTLRNLFLKEGIIMRPLGNTIYIMPPYCITDQQLHKVYDAIIKILGII